VAVRSWKFESSPGHHFFDSARCELRKIEGTNLLDIVVHKGDLPADIDFGDAVAVDSETMGLDPLRDRLCLVQLSSGDGTCHLVQFTDGVYHAPNLCALLTDSRVAKLFHFARFDMAVLHQYLGIDVGPVYCTKIASKLVRTYTDRHGLKDLCREILGVELSKQQQSSDWGAIELSEEQVNYAASDVLYLHRLRERLDQMIDREGRRALLEASFAYLPTRIQLDLQGWGDEDIFHH
jgi:ribonuclease D